MGKNKLGLFVDFFWKPFFRQKELIAEIREDGTPLVGIVSFVPLMAMIGIFVLLLSLAFHMVYFLAFGWIESALNTFKVINPNLFMLGVVGALFALYKVLIMFLIDRIGKDPVSFGVEMAAVGSFSIMDMYAVAYLRGRKDPDGQEGDPRILHPLIPDENVLPRTLLMHLKAPVFPGRLSGQKFPDR